MKNLTALLFASLFLNTAPAQDSTLFAPINASWTYRPYDYYRDTGLYTFTSLGDTLLDGWNAKILRCSVWQQGGMQAAPELDKCVATVGNQVFYRVAGEFVLLFDFGAQPGDTIFSKAEHFPIFDGCAMPDTGEVWEFCYRIDSVHIISINGTALRRQFATSLYKGLDPDWTIGGLGSSVAIIERIGAVHAGYWWGSGGACILSGVPGYFRCYDDRDMHYSGPIGNQACDYVGVREAEVLPLEFSPNPASDRVLVRFPEVVEGQIRVFSSIGREILDQPLSGTSAEIHLGSWPTGLYTVQFQELSGRAWVGKLVIQ